MAGFTHNFLSEVTHKLSIFPQTIAYSIGEIC